MSVDYLYRLLCLDLLNQTFTASISLHPFYVLDVLLLLDMAVARPGAEAAGAGRAET